MTYAKYGFLIDDAVTVNSEEYRRKLREGWTIVCPGENGFVTMKKDELKYKRKVVPL